MKRKDVLAEVTGLIGGQDLEGYLIKTCWK
jgi:hypothetical protein